jgi:hypothetical protein
VDGRRFKGQFSVGNYILDFYFPKKKLAVELDGQDHYTIWGVMRDEKRTEFLDKQGIRVIRFENIVVYEDLESVLEEIRRNFRGFRQAWKRKLKKSPPPRQAGETPLLQRGEYWNSRADWYRGWIGIQLKNRSYLRVPDK